MSSDEIRAAILDLKKVIGSNDTLEEVAEAVEEAEGLQSVLDEAYWNVFALFVREDYFYGGFAEDLARQLGPVVGWPYDCIDWDKAAQALRQDYRSVNILGDHYLVRA